MEKTVSSKTIFSGKVITVRLDEVLLENGNTATREVVEHPGAVAIVAITENSEVLFVRQFRKALEKDLLEIPAGKLEPGEDPETCAGRELAEETDMKAGKLRHIASYYSSPGFASEKLDIYLATNLLPVSVEKPGDELITLERIPLHQAVEMARQGQIEDGKTLIALLLAEDLLT